MARVKNIGRGRIVEAARQVLQQRGPEAVTIKAVAEKAEVTQGAVYYYFNAKEDLINELIRSSVDEQIQRFDAAFESTEDDLMRIDRTLDAVRDVFLKDDDFHRRFFGLVAKGLADESSAREINHIMVKIRETIERRLRDVIAREDKSGVPLEHFGRILRAVFDGLALQSLFDKEIDIDAVFQSLKGIVMALYRLNETEP